MSSTGEDVINDLNKKSEAAYEKLSEAIRELHSIGIAESAITLSVRVLYRDINEELEEQDAILRKLS